MRGQAFIAASALAIMMIAQSASAQQYGSYQDEYVQQSRQCQQTQTGRTVGGAVIGGAAGAALGSNIGAHGHRSDGGLLGAAVGALLGGAIGNDSAKHSAACNEQVEGNYDPYYGNRYADNGQYQGRPYPRDSYRDGDDNGYSGDDRRYCRMGEETFRDPYGREYTENVMMCRGRDGVWRPER
jgi:hypothetical protein